MTLDFWAELFEKKRYWAWVRSALSDQKLKVPKKSEIALAVTFRDQRKQTVLISFTPQIGANSSFNAIEGIIVKASIMPYYHALAQSKKSVTANPALARQLS